MGLLNRDFNTNVPRQSDVKRTMRLILEKYDSRLEEYSGTLLKYQSRLEENEALLMEYKQKLNEIEATEEDQMAAVQVALDLTYIKEELDEVKQHQEEVLTLQANELEEKLHKILGEFAQLKAAIAEPLEKQLHKDRDILEDIIRETEKNIVSSGSGWKKILGISMVFHIISLGGIVFGILYMLGIIWF